MFKQKVMNIDFAYVFINVSSQQLGPWIEKSRMTVIGVESVVSYEVHLM
jgi:hypothetical protein